MIRRPPRSTQSRSSAASDVYKRQPPQGETDEGVPKNGLKPEFPVKSGWRNLFGRFEAADEIRQPERRDDSHRGPESQGEGRLEQAAGGQSGGSEQAQNRREPEET